MDIQVGDVNVEAIDGFAQALQGAPRRCSGSWPERSTRSPSTDVETFRRELPARLKIRKAGLAGAFKGVASKPAMATDLSKVFASVYTGWKAAEIFETGGTIGRGKSLTVLTAAGRTSAGRRLYTQKQLLAMMNTGKVRFIRRPAACSWCRTWPPAWARAVPTARTPGA